MSESFAEMLEESIKQIHTGEIVDGTVIDVKEDQIILNIGSRRADQGQPLRDKAIGDTVEGGRGRSLSLLQAALHDAAGGQVGH